MTATDQPANPDTPISGKIKVHVFRDDALGNLDATGVADAIRARKISATEAVEAAISRTEAVRADLDPLQHEDYERARARARIFDQGGKVTRYASGDDDGRGDFGGVPMAFKDNVAVQGMPMTQGSRAMPMVPQAENGKIAKQWLGLGVIPIGTTTMPPFGWTGVTERQGFLSTSNPWNTAYNAGGSSGGTAALVAAGALPFAHGNDGGGSIRIPAHACGLIGLKPTRGRLIPSDAAASAPIRLVNDGVLARSVRDVANFYASMEVIYKNKLLRPVGRAGGPIRKRLRIGVMINSPATEPAHADSRKAVEDTAALLESLGHSVEPYELRLPDYFVEDFQDYWGFLAMMVAKMGKKTVHPLIDPTAHDNMTLGLATRGRKHLKRFPIYMARLASMNPMYRRQFANGPDLVLTPTMNHPTPLNDYLAVDLPFEEQMERLLKWVSFTPLANVTGSPALTLPVATDSNGMPMSVMFSGAHNSERMMLKLAFEIEKAQPWAKITD